MHVIRFIAFFCIGALVGCSSDSTSSKKGPPPPSGTSRPAASVDDKTPEGKTAKLKEDLKVEAKTAKKPASTDLPWDSEVVLDNRTDVSLELVVDGASKGTAAPGATTSATVSPGSHLLKATTPDGRAVTRTESFLAGDRVNWVVSLEKGP